MDGHSVSSQIPVSQAELDLSGCYPEAFLELGSIYQGVLNCKDKEILIQLGLKENLPHVRRPQVGWLQLTRL